MKPQPLHKIQLVSDVFQRKPVDSTFALLAFKALNHDIDEEWVQWAQEMLAAGFDTEHLRILAGETKPFNQFEMHELTDKALSELQLDYRDQDKVVKEYIQYLLTLCLNSKIEQSKVLDILKNFYLESIDKEYLTDFYTLWNAHSALQTETIQWYWEGATRYNIDQVIRDYFIRWKKMYFPGDTDFGVKPTYEVEKSNAITFKIIHSKTYKNVVPFLIGIFLFSYFLSFIFFFPMWVIYLMTAVNISIPIAMWIYSKNFKREGYLSIDTQNVVVARNQNLPRVFPISQLKDFKISRGSTVHHYDDRIYAPETHDNWIYFTYNDHKHKVEFTIHSRDENEKFEEIVYKLRRKYPDFYYESI